MPVVLLLFLCSWATRRSQGLSGRQLVELPLYPFAVAALQGLPLRVQVHLWEDGDGMVFMPPPLLFFVFVFARYLVRPGPPRAGGTIVQFFWLFCLAET
jgi:hypothetical protein